VSYNYSDSLFSFYNDISVNRYPEFTDYLKETKIEIINDFIGNENNIKLFYESFVYRDNYKVFLCGINPGIRGAGQTGIPFMDFNTLGKIFSTQGIRNNLQGYEGSANYFQTIVKEIGYERFYNTFYVTNISCIGFYCIGNKGRKVNMNYYILPVKLQHILYLSLLKEIELLKPELIIPLSEEVEITLKNIREDFRLSFEIEQRLKHPNFCNMRSKNFAVWKQEYISLLQKYL